MAASAVAEKMPVVADPATPKTSIYDKAKNISFLKGMFSDVWINIVEEEKRKTFRANRVLLASQSPFFAAYFKFNNHTLEPDIRRASDEITIKEIDIETFEQVLKFVNTGWLEPSDDPVLDAKLAAAAEYLDIEPLYEFVVDRIRVAVQSDPLRLSTDEDYREDVVEALHRLYSSVLSRAHRLDSKLTNAIAEARVELSKSESFTLLLNEHEDLEKSVKQTFEYLINSGRIGECKRCNFTSFTVATCAKCTRPVSNSFANKNFDARQLSVTTCTSPHCQTYGQFLLQCGTCRTAGVAVKDAMWSMLRGRSTAEGPVVLEPPPSSGNKMKEKMRQKLQPERKKASLKKMFGMGKKEGRMVWLEGRTMTEAQREETGYIGNEPGVYIGVPSGSSNMR